MRLNRVIAVIAIMFSVLVIYGARSFEVSMLGDDYAGPAFFPVVCSVFLIILAIALFITSKNDKKIKSINYKALIIPVFAIILLIIYITIMPLAGFLLSTFVLNCALLVAFKVRRYIAIPFFAATVSGLIYYIFSNLLTVDLPAGNIPDTIQKVIFGVLLTYLAVASIYSAVSNRRRKC